MSRPIQKSHNVSVLLYHIACPAKYRRVVVNDQVDQVLKDVCLEIAKRYDMRFIEISTDGDHVHFLVQSVPTSSPTKIVRTIKSITAHEIFKQVPSVKQQLSGGQFWSDGYYIATVGQLAREDVIRNSIKQQGQSSDYQQLHTQQLRLFDLDTP